jgi:hypothetical protein
MFDQGQAMSANTLGMTFPAWDYPTATGCAITGGYTYRGPSIPDLVGWHIFSDYCSGRIWGIVAATAATLAPPVFEFTPGPGGGISSFGEEQSGEIYVVRHGAGQILRIVPV